MQTKHILQTITSMMHSMRVNDGHFTYGTLCLLDSLPTVWSFHLLDTSPTGNFAYNTLHLWDISPTRPNLRQDFDNSKTFTVSYKI